MAYLRQLQRRQLSLFRPLEAHSVAKHQRRRRLPARTPQWLVARADPNRDRHAEWMDGIHPSVLVRLRFTWRLE
jgi:hypothetical protein